MCIKLIDNVFKHSALKKKPFCSWHQIFCENISKWYLSPNLRFTKSNYLFVCMFSLQWKWLNCWNQNWTFRKEPTSWNQFQGTKFMEPISWNQVQETNFMEPISGNQFNGTNFRKPISLNQFQETNFMEPISGNQFHGTNFLEPISRNKFQGTNFR